MGRCRDEDGMKNLEKLPQGSKEEGVNKWKKQHYLSTETQAKVIKHYAKGFNIAKAAKLSGVTRASIDNERKINPEFDGMMKEILDAELDTLEEEQHLAAHERSDDRRFVLTRRRPETWSEKKQTQVSGHISVGHHVRDLSDKELEDIVMRGKLPLAAEFTVTEENSHGPQTLPPELGPQDGLPTQGQDLEDE